MYTAVRTGLIDSFLCDNGKKLKSVGEARLAWISRNKLSQNVNLSRVFTQIEVGLLRKLEIFWEIQARAGLGVFNFKVWISEKLRYF